MKWVLLVFLCIVSVCADNTDDKVEETSEDNVREVREYSQENWRSVEQYAEPNFDWVPHEPPPEYKPKRRRLRKRKRRPPVSQDDDTSGDEYFAERPIRRRVRPFRLQQAQEPWEEMQDEPNIRPNIRRRIIPAYNVQEETTEWEGPTFSFPSRDTIKSKADEVRPKNEDVNEKSNVEDVVENNETQTQANHITDLKNLLKQSGTLSLSEILQQKNLSLSELLSGNEKAISALTEKPLEATKPTEFSSQSLGPHQATSNHDKSIKDDSLEQVPDIQKKRLPNFNTATEEKFPLVTKLDVVTEAMTERRIFVPSHPKYYTSLSFKPDFDSQSEKLTEPVTSTTTSAPEVPTTRSIIKQKLPTTNAKLRYTIKEKAENYPPVFHFPKAAKIDINEVLGIGDYKSEHTTEKVTTTNIDEPLRMPIDLDLIIGNARVNSSKLNPSTEVPSMNLTYVTAREEIMEVLNDPASREKLAKILEHRNMTVEELVQQRERGSSQRHLADIFHNKSKEPEPKDEPHVAPIEGHFDPELLKNFYERQQKSQKFEDVLPKKVPAVDIIQKEVSKPKEKPVKTTAPNITDNKIEPIPWIGEIIPVLPTDGNEVKTVNIPRFKFSTEDYFLEDIPRLETVDNAFDLASNEEPNAEEIQSDQDALFKIPSGVKSAIFVSLAIVGLSMVVFLTILIIFRWSQKDKRNINYCRSLSSRFRSPMILQGRPTNAIRTFVNETLGRKKNYYKSNVQRMCDDIWEGGKDMDKKLSF